MRAITLLRSGGLGDTLLVLPVCDWLRARHPQARIRLVVDARWRSVVACCPSVAQALPLDALPLHLLYADADPAPLAALAADQDLVLHYATGGAALAAPWRRITRGRVIVHDPRPLPGERRHITRRLLAALDPGDGETAPLPAARIAPSAEMRAAAQATLAAFRLDPARLLLVHPGSGGADKCLPWEVWRALIAWAVETLGAQPLLLWGPAEEERWGAPACPWPLLRAPALETLAAILAVARLYAGHDSGPTHLAAVAGCPTVAVFCATDPALWRPPGERVLCVGDEQALRAAVARAWG